MCVRARTCVCVHVCVQVGTGMHAHVECLSFPFRWGLSLAWSSSIGLDLLAGRPQGLLAGLQVCTTPDIFFYWHFHIDAADWTWVLVQVRDFTDRPNLSTFFFFVFFFKIYLYLDIPRYRYLYIYLYIYLYRYIEGEIEREIWYSFPWVLWNLAICIWC